MPQAVEAYIDGENLGEVDRVKREIIELYKADFMKIDPSGRISAIFEAIPVQLSAKKSQFRIIAAMGKQKRQRVKATRMPSTALGPASSACIRPLVVRDSLAPSALGMTCNLRGILQVRL